MTEYGVRYFGGHIEPKPSAHLARQEVERRLAAGEKNVWLVQRYVEDWRRCPMPDTRLDQQPQDP